MALEHIESTQIELGNGMVVVSCGKGSILVSTGGDLFLILTVCFLPSLHVGVCSFGGSHDFLTLSTTSSRYTHLQMVKTRDGAPQ